MDRIIACPKCGTPSEETATACSSCGYVRPPFAQQRRPMPALTNQHAIGSAVTGTLGLVIPFVLSIAAIVLAVRARTVFKANPALGGRSLAGMGLGLGLAGLAGWIYVAVKIATR